MSESRSSDEASSLARAVREQTQELNAQQGQADKGRLYDTSRVQVVCINPSVMTIDKNLTTSTSFQHGISRSDEVSFTVKIEAPPPHSKLSDACDGGFDHSNHVTRHAGLAPEEPLQIQCGENSALLYVSKLCQGSKGPCILFQNEWLTPNELQYISGRETAKDWKRSIRHKGKSLKSLIARGLVRVHPPICDCLGCRISSPVNRGRLADKCGLSPTSLKKRRDAPKSMSSWHDEQVHGSRHFSSTDMKHSLERRAPATSNAIDQQDSNSSTSECSEISAEESAFYSAGDKRPRNLTPPTMDSRAGARKRRASDSASVCYPGQEHFHLDGNGRGLSADSSIQKDPGARCSLEGNERNHATNSAFRTILKDGSLTMTTHPKETGDSNTCTQSDALQRDLARTFKARGMTPAHSFFPPQFAQCLSPATIIRPGQNSQRLISDPYLLASHASKLYQRAGLQSLQQNYLHYGLMAPMHQNVTQNFQASSMVADSEPRVDSSSPHQTSSRCASPVSKESSWKDKDAGREELRINGEGPCTRPASNEARNHAAKPNDHEIIAQKSQVSSPSLSDVPNSFVTLKSPLHKRVPRLHMDLNDDVLAWNADDVCHFVMSITRSAEISQIFRDENIDGHSLVLIREEHLLDRMSIKLGPALKILAQVNKLVESMEIGKESNPTGFKIGE